VARDGRCGSAVEGPLRRPRKPVVLEDLVATALLDLVMLPGIGAPAAPSAFLVAPARQRQEPAVATAAGEAPFRWVEKAIALLEDRLRWAASFRYESKRSGFGGLSNITLNIRFLSKAVQPRRASAGIDEQVRPWRGWRRARGHAAE